MLDSLLHEQAPHDLESETQLETIFTMLRTHWVRTFTQNRHPKTQSDPSRVSLENSLKRRLGIDRLLYNEVAKNGKPEDPLLTGTERLYIVVWWSIFSMSTYVGYKFSPKQQLSLTSEVLYWVIMFIVVAAMGIPNPKKKRDWILHNVLGLDLEHSKHYGRESRVAQFYNGLKMWLLMPLVFLGIWAPWAPVSRKWAWIGAILPILCIVIGATILGLDSYHMIRVTTHRPFKTHDFNKYFWAILFDTCELLTYVVAVIIFNQPNTVKTLFEFDNTNMVQSKSEASVGSAATENLVGSSSTGNLYVHAGDSSNSNDEEEDGVEMDDQTKNSVSVSVECEKSNEHTLHLQISDKLVYTAWEWVVWFLSPALMYCYVAYVSSVLFDASSNDWRTLFPQNHWLPWVYDVSPFGGTNFSVGTGHVSGVLLVMAAYVWFVCMTVSMELNRIAIRRAEGELDTAALYALIETASNRMEGLVGKFKYIIAIQFIYSVILLSLIFIHVFRVVPPSIAILDVNGWTGVSAFVLVFEFVVTAHYASNIRKQWDMIVAVVVGQQQKHLQNPQNVPDFAPIYDHLKLSPFGIHIFGFAFNMTFVKTLAVGVLTQVAGFVWAWLTEFLKTRT